MWVHVTGAVPAGALPSLSRTFRPGAPGSTGRRGEGRKPGLPPSSAHCPSSRAVSGLGGIAGRRPLTQLSVSNWLPSSSKPHARRSPAPLTKPPKIQIPEFTQGHAQSQELSHIRRPQAWSPHWGFILYLWFFPIQKQFTS